MSDFNSGLPIRTENAGDAIVKVADATVPSQQLKINSDGSVDARAADATGNLITSQASGAQRALDVGINVAGTQVDPRQVRPLTSTDVVTANQGAAAAASAGWPVKPTDGTNSQSFTAAGEAKVSVTQPLPAGTNLLGAVNLDVGSSPVSMTNPIPVTITDSVAGLEVGNYNTTAAVAAAATSNHDYTVTTGKTLSLMQILASSSGKMKIEVQIETAAASGVFNTKAVLFNSTANPNMEYKFEATPEVVAGARVRIIRTNKDQQAQDLYSTISGKEN